MGPMLLNASVAWRQMRDKGGADLPNFVRASQLTSCWAARHASTPLLRAEVVLQLAAPYTPLGQDRVGCRVRLA